MTAAYHALTSTEKLARQREAAAIARSHAHALQVKVVIACGCVMAGALGFAIHHASFGSGGVTPQPVQAAPVVRQGPSTVRIGQVQVPDHGETCVHYRFDNVTGTLGDEKTVSCAPINVRPPEMPNYSRTQAIMNAFRFNR
jgi:hypothetical protein